ncbi:MAG: T9SS type A sorting domain-containing protein [Candidatus Delongbacteria bacterium]|jgi:ABC-type dipeptide/oligopeptide/nickel transport system ATPase subunit|nr:T9SS type A sorting domain-containing protein [Candidatus Delongbacteria bacterium]
MKKIYILVFIMSIFSLNCYGFTFRSSIGQSVIGETSLGEDTVKSGVIYLDNSESKSKNGVTENIPYEFGLEQNYPNPFNPTTTIQFSLPEDQFVSLKVYNVLGAEVVELAGKDFTKGVHKVNFNANKCVSGLYFYRMQTKGFSNIKKMMIVK